MEDAATGGQLDLPLRLDRSFRPWQYQVSHRRLIFRSTADELGEQAGLVFLDVLGMKIRHHYDRLFIAGADESSEIDDFVDVPRRHNSRYLKLIVSDGIHAGFVVCASVRMYESESDYQRAIGDSA